MSRLENILESNNVIKRSTLKTIKEYLDIQQRFFEKVESVFQQLRTIESVANIFLNDELRTLLNEFKPMEKVHLTICGYNSVGKTTFANEFLKCGNFLLTGIDAISALIIKFSYATANEACVIKYVAQPEIGKMSDEFARWASQMIEIRVPSRVLQLGIDIYDSPGFLGEDPPILAENLLKLISSVRPSLIYLFDNPTVSDDSRKYDILTILKDNEDGDIEDEDQLLNNEREKRYNLLINVTEISSTFLNGQHVLFDQCNCFDIFSSQGSTDRMEDKMKQHAFDNIVRFAAEQDLHSTKQVICIVLDLIDDFFKFYSYY
ncbi:unnamed protein product [Rotaria sp. Silwood1]|nr:unnamed protein product [Rotaria sp. Silwood1]CAF4923178.1 unnamed protein product [Rotaria sp. Silwood1]